MEQNITLDKFNDRNREVFGDVYLYLFDDMFRYINYITADNHIDDAEDIIHDIFIDLWRRNSIKFDSMIKLKGFLIIAINNRVRNNIRHSKHTSKYFEQISKSTSYDILEFELYSIFNEIREILPSESAEILQLFFEGHKPAEIAKLLNKSPQIIYNKKNEALSILRKKLSRDNNFIISLFLN